MSTGTEPAEMPRLPVPRPRVYLAVEGPTGVGKSTLTGRLAQRLGAEMFADPFEHNPFLPQLAIATGQQVRELALPTELAFLGLRILQLRRIQAAVGQGQIVIADWTLAKTKVFPRTTLEADDADRLEVAGALWSADLPEPIWSSTCAPPPAVLAARIAGRDRPFERTLTPAALESLAALFDAALAAARFLIVDTDDFDVFDDAALSRLADRVITLISTPSSN